MKAFYCACGWRVFFENTECLDCHRPLGFDPLRGELVSLDSCAQDSHVHVAAAGGRYLYRLCRNYRERRVCNWVLCADAPGEYCLACDLNQAIAGSGDPKHSQWWADMEAAKRRLLYTLLMLRLPVVSKRQDPQRGLAFAFLQDRRHDPGAEHEFVITGHRDGLITVNMIEADHAARESTRERMNESYRTLLGHFRHESGHYYWYCLVEEAGRLEEFRAIFGDERAAYRTALDRHYAHGAQGDWQAGHISAYACAHPWEDWAETWAHYLHIIDALETAQVFGVVDVDLDKDGFDHGLTRWAAVTIMLNELNRSVGQYDAYPFVLSGPIRRKLRFVHDVVRAARPAHAAPPAKTTP